jgi:dienelactone hydrolase
MRAVLLLLLLPAAPQERPAEEGRFPCRRLRPSGDPELQARLARYEPAEADFPWTLREASRSGAVIQSWLKFPSPTKGAAPESDVVWARVWEPAEREAPGPAAILLHWLGGRFDALEAVGRRLAENGVTALMLYLPGYGPREPKGGERRGNRLPRQDLESAFASMRQSVMDVRRAGDWLASRRGVEPSRIGLVGISLGSIVGSLALGVDDRFGRSVFFIGGGDVPAVVFHGSKETAAARDRLVEEGWSVDRLREAWKDAEPLTFAGRVRPEEVLLVNAESDEVIPRACTERLHAAMGGPELRWFAGGHYALIFRLGGALKDILEHLGRRTAW